jgi:hypothetical protein
VDAVAAQTWRNVWDSWTCALSEEKLFEGAIMFVLGKMGFSLFGLVASCIVLTPKTTQATNITWQGLFTYDDDLQLFNLTVAAANSVDIRSYGYGGGTTSTGTIVPSGGFDTILTLFDQNGAFLADNDEGTGVAIDPLTGRAFDARLTTNLVPGSYVAALTQFDNFSLGNLADGFAETGHPNFTADPTFTAGGACPGNMFRDISGTAGRCRDGNWAVDFVNVASVTPQAPVPEPAALILSVLSLGCLILVVSCRNTRKARLILGSAVVGLAAFHVQAQSTGPAYSNVSDFLNGKRTLLRDQDLVVYILNPTTPPPGILHSSTQATAVINTANGLSTTGQVQQMNINMTDDRIEKPFAGRLYESDHDQYLTVVPTADVPYLLMTDGNNTTNLPSFPSVKLGSNYTTFSAVMADFNGDGYADLAVNFGPGAETGDMVIFSGAAKDGTFSAHYGPVHGIDDPNESQQETLLNMTAGDFYGDGRKEIAGLAYKSSGAYVLCIYAVDPATLAITKVSEITPDYSAEGALSPAQFYFYSLTAGKLTAETNQQLVYAYATATGRDTKIAVFDFSNSGSSLSMKELTIFDALSQPESLGDLIQVQAARFDPTSSYDLIAFLFAWQGVFNDYGSGTKYIRTFSFDPQSNLLTANPTTDFSEFSCAGPMTIGNFDKKTTVSGMTQPDLTLQIAFVISNCTPGQTNSLLFILGASADGKSYTPDQEGYTIPENISSLGLMNVTAGDTQGRSYVLGEPTKITLMNTTQPAVAIGAPPMHVDFVSPGNNQPPEVFNVSAIPGGFTSTYNQQSSTSTTIADTKTTSWTFGAKESVNASVTVGDPDVSGFKASDTFTAAQNLKGAAEHDWGSFSSQSYSVTLTTGFGDEVTQTNEDFYIWEYPVIGKTVCPAEKPNCADSEKVPLTVLFSAPSAESTTRSAAGQATTGYQPPWEPGNVFSYPATLQQLQAIYPNLNLLTTQGQTFFTDDNPASQSTSWAVGGTDTKSTSFAQNYSFENDFSVTGSFQIAGIGAGGGYGLDVSGSVGFENLNKNTSTLSASSGVQFNKPGTFPTPVTLYGYNFAPYLMGTTQPGGYVDSQPLPGDVKTFGVLRAMYTADPIPSSFGNWWTTTYTIPDVALNHPLRWKKVPSSPPIGGNCLPTGGGAYDCWELSNSAPDNPVYDVVHQMRGFFISSAQSPGQGPQLDQATAGDVLTLEARVYNYSLAAMPSGTKVHVRFYFQPMNGSSPTGNSVQIGQDVVLNGPIPPFSDSAGAPLNWVLAQTTFDTGQYDQTKNGNASLMFWVVVWMQDANSGLVSEMPGHGLTAIPGPLNSLVDVAKLEECQSDGHCYSNNVGFYDQAFPILPTTNGVGAPPPSGTASIDIEKVQVSEKHFTPHDTVAVSTTLSVSGAAASGVSADFYDGDPQDGGTLFNVVRVPYIAQDAQYSVLAPYQTSTCGMHELFVVVNDGKATKVVRRAPPVKVDCNKLGSLRHE